MKTITLVAEHSRGQLKSVTNDLVAFARRLGQFFSAEIKVIILGDDISESAGIIAAKTGLDVIALQSPDAANYNAEIYLQALTDLFREIEPAYVCLAHNSQGIDYGPSLAVKLNAECISAVEGIFSENGSVGFTRPLYGGKFVSHVCPVSDCAIVLVQPGVFKDEDTNASKTGKVTIQTTEYALSQSKPLGIREAEASTAGITEADVVVSAGRGIGEQENLDLIYQLAALFPKSAVAGSRIVCDMGWLEYNQQVGVTGATVSPDLYIACGISGAVQHVMAMRGSGFVVSINTDPYAAIFNESDVCIIEDLQEFIPVLIETCKNSSPHT